jgi:hypothetical protein
MPTAIHSTVPWSFFSAVSPTSLVGFLCGILEPILVVLTFSVVGRDVTFESFCRGGLQVVVVHSVFFGPFLSGCFFPPNDHAQNHAQKNPIFSTVFVGTKVSLDVNSEKKCKQNILF